MPSTLHAPFFRTRRLLAQLGRMAPLPLRGPRLEDDVVVARWHAHTLPERFRMLVDEAGVLTRGVEELQIEQGRVEPGAAVALLSGHRVAFRRVLAVHDTFLRVRCDVAPFEERFDGPVLGTVRPRVIDLLPALSPERFTRTTWNAAMASAQLLSVRRRMNTPRRVKLVSRLLTAEDWPAVRAFWLRDRGVPLDAKGSSHQYVIGLFDGSELVGANIQLVFGTTSYSAFTLVARSYRGLGGGRRMIDHAVEVARQRGLASIYVHIHARNVPSLAAYEGAGFRFSRWWSDDADPLAAAERQWKVYELELG